MDQTLALSDSFSKDGVHSLHFCLTKRPVELDMTCLNCRILRFLKEKEISGRPNAFQPCSPGKEGLLLTSSRAVPD